MSGLAELSDRCVRVVGHGKSRRLAISGRVLPVRDYVDRLLSDLIRDRSPGPAFDRLFMAGSLRNLAGRLNDIRSNQGVPLPVTPAEVNGWRSAEGWSAHEALGAAIGEWIEDQASVDPILSRQLAR